MFDAGRFEELYRRFYAPIFEYCLTRLSFDRDASAEAADNAFLALHRRWDDLEIGGNVKLWLYRAADNYIKKALRKRERAYRKTVQLGDGDDYENDAAFSRFDEYFSTDVPEEELISRVRSALPEEKRELFSLRYEKKKKLSEISELLGTPYSTVRRRLAGMEAEIRDAVKKAADCGYS
ncbi:MAG: sigma-70 family RNA polymerase sigma factor [Clostridia bacterium]|nr:sigma-70 family RNA polymerase sigma factor [Clostridia bacterium]